MQNRVHVYRKYENKGTKTTEENRPQNGLLNDNWETKKTNNVTRRRPMEGWGWGSALISNESSSEMKHEVRERSEAHRKGKQKPYSSRSGGKVISIY